MMCSYCGGRLTDPTPTPEWSPLMSNPETGELYSPDSRVAGFRSSCSKCKRGYNSLDGKRFFSRGAYNRIIEAVR